MRIIPVTLINILLLGRLGTFKDEQEFPPASKRAEYMQLHAFVSGQILRHHGHHIFLILAWQKINRKVVTLLQFEPLHLNNPLPPPPAKQTPQNLRYLHCFNKGNDILRELPPPSATDCQYQADSPGEEQPHVHHGPPAAGSLGLGSLQPPTTSALVPTLLPRQLVSQSTAVPQGSTPSTPFSFGFPICMISCWHEASFQQHTTAPLPLLIHAELFPKAVSHH